MSSGGARALAGCLAVTLALSLPTGALAQEQEPLTAEQAIEAARDAYYVTDGDYVTVCPEDTAQGNDVIVVCRRVRAGNVFRTRNLPSPRMDRTADGVPRAPDVSTIPPCVPGGLSMCIGGLGWVPPPAYIVDVTAFPEPLAPEVAAKVFAVEDKGGVSVSEP